MTKCTRCWLIDTGGEYQIKSCPTRKRDQCDRIKRGRKAVRQFNRQRLWNLIRGAF